MSKPIVLLDVDGVLANWLDPALEIAGRISGKTYEPSQMTTWDLFDLVSRDHEEACYVEFCKQGFCSSLKPLPGSIEAVTELQKTSEVHIVTSPTHSPFWYYERVEWLADHYKIPKKKVHFSSHKELIRGDIFVDDALHHATHWAEAHPYGRSFLWDAYYNRNEPSSRKFIRITDWSPVIYIASRFNKPPVVY